MFSASGSRLFTKRVQIAACALVVLVGGTLIAPQAGASTPLAGATSSTVAAAAPGAYVALTPSRLIDTRSGIGTPKAQIGPGKTLIVQAGGKAGIPATGVGAAVVNINVVNATAPGRMVVWADGTTKPNMSSVNFVANQAGTSLVATRMSSAGKVALWNSSAKPVDVIVDVNGYWAGGTVTAAGGMVPVAPTRSLDTRSGLGAKRADFVDNNPYFSLSWQVAGRNAVPADVTAVVMAVTATNVLDSGRLVPFDDMEGHALWPFPWSGDEEYFQRANGFAFAKNVPVTTLFVVPLSTAGKAKIEIEIAEGNTPAPGIDLLGDVLGYIRGGGAIAGGFYQPLPVGHLTNQTIPGNSAVNLPVPVPAGATVAVGVTVTAGSSSGGIIAFEQGTTRPSTRNVNFAAGQRVSNLVMVKTSASSSVSLANVSSSPVTVAVDLAGYSRAAAAPPARTVWAWGKNGHAGMATGYFSVGSGIPAPVPLANVKAVAWRWESSYAVDGDGALWVWGNNEDDGVIGSGGELGLGNYVDQPVPVKLPGMANVLEVDPTYYGASALKADGTVWYWGQLDFENADHPIKVAGLSNVVSIDGGHAGGYAAKSDGTVARYFYNLEWDQGCPNDDCLAVEPVSGLTNVAQIDSGFAIRKDGTVARWRTDTGVVAPVVISNLAAVKTISGGYALKTNGTVWALPATGAVATQVPGLTSVTALGAYAVKSDGTVWSLSPSGATRLRNVPLAANVPPAPQLIVAR